MWEDAGRYLSKDKYVSPLIKIWGPCSIAPDKHNNYFESLCANIVGQQLSGKAADTIFARFKTAVGGKIYPDSVLKTDPQFLRDSGMSWGKVSYVKDLAQRAKSGKLHTKNLRNLPDEEVIRELIEVKGIGRWTAEMFLMFSLGRPDIFLIDDLGIKKGFEKVTGLSWDKTSASQFAEKQWKPYRTVASWYLWRSLENR